MIQITEIYSIMILLNLQILLLLLFQVHLLQATSNIQDLPSQVSIFSTDFTKYSIFQYIQDDLTETKISLFNEDLEIYLQISFEFNKNENYGRKIELIQPEEKEENFEANHFIFNFFELIIDDYDDFSMSIIHNLSKFEQLQIHQSFRTIQLDNFFIEIGTKKISEQALVFSTSNNSEYQVCRSTLKNIIKEYNQDDPENLLVIFHNLDSHFYCESYEHIFGCDGDIDEDDQFAYFSGQILRLAICEDIYLGYTKFFTLQIFLLRWNLRRLEPVDVQSAQKAYFYLSYPVK